MKIRFFDSRKGDHKARIDSLEFLCKGFVSENLAGWRYSASSSFIRFCNEFVAIMRLKAGSELLFIQFPPHAVELPLIYLAIFKRIQLIFLVHDIDALRGRTNRGLTLFRDKSGYGILLKGHVIAHTETMTSVLKREGIKSTEELWIFDYINEARPYEYSASIAEDSFPTEVEYIFVGNLSPLKSGFIYKLGQVIPNLVVYGSNFTGAREIDYRGQLPSNHASHYSNKMVFGIVWDGESPESLSGSYGEYLRINSPHKSSLYLSMGIPLVVSSESALAAFVLKSKIGIVVDSLHNLPRKIDSDTYGDLIINVKLLRMEVLNGSHLFLAVENILRKVT